MVIGRETPIYTSPSRIDSMNELAVSHVTRQSETVRIPGHGKNGAGRHVQQCRRLSLTYITGARLLRYHTAYEMAAFLLKYG
jgi:hypothetical protein